jgi:hypothetical protein
MAADAPLRPFVLGQYRHSQDSPKLAVVQPVKSGEPTTSLNNLNPIAARQLSFVEGSAFKYATIRFNDFPGSNIRVLTGDKEVRKSDFLRLRNSEGQHSRRITLAPFAWADAVANMATSLDEVRMVNVVAYLDGTEEFRTFGIGKKKQVCRHSRWIRFGQIALDDQQKFIEVFSRKKLTRRRRRFDNAPSMNHVFVGSAMVFVWNFQD